MNAGTLTTVSGDAPNQGIPQANLAALKEFLALNRKSEPLPKSHFPSIATVSYNINGRKFSVSISEAKVPAREIGSVVPPGYRAITLEEGALLWLHGERFRRLLLSIGGLWTGRQELDGLDPCLIDKGGFLHKVLESKFDKLPEERRAIRNGGHGPVAIFNGPVGRRKRSRWFFATADNEEGSKTQLNVAYIVGGNNGRA